MKVLFFGTPQIAVPYLDWLIQHHEVVGVVCKPDEPVGRGHKIQSPPVKVLAQQKNLPVYQPEGKWTDETIAPLKSAGAKVGVAVAYGRLMPRNVFMAPELGTLNVHFSLLPKYRGAGPLQWSLINGEKETGVTVFWIEEGMDSGPIFSQGKCQVQEQENATTLREKLVPLGIETLDWSLKEIEKNNIIKKPQEGEPSSAPQLTKELGHVDWTWPAKKIANLIAGVYEWPGATTQFSPEGSSEKKLKIFKVSCETSKKGQPGEILEARKNKGVLVQTGEDALLLEEVQPEGKKRMPGWAFWLGARLKVGEKLG